MAGRFFVVRGSVTSGPFSSRQLKELAAAGGIQPTDGVQQEGKEKIHLACTVVGLFPAGDGVVSTAPAAISPRPTAAPTSLAAPLPLRRSAATPELSPVLLAAAPLAVRAGTAATIDEGGREWTAAHGVSNALGRHAHDLLAGGGPADANVAHVQPVDQGLTGGGASEPGEYSLAPVDWSPPQPPSDLPEAEAAASLGSDSAAVTADAGGGWFESWFGGGEVDATGTDGSWLAGGDAVAGADLADAAGLADAADLGDAADVGLDALGDIDFSCFF